jgi:aspartyl aminopeptidase
MPQLSMHSIREMMGGKDLTHAHQLFVGFFQEFSNIDKNFKADPVK